MSGGPDRADVLAGMRQAMAILDALPAPTTGQGEWWIGARRNAQCDWWEIGLLGLALCRPDERKPRRPQVPSAVVLVPCGQGWCSTCGDVNYDVDSRLCLTCAYPNDPCSTPLREPAR